MGPQGHQMEEGPPNLYSPGHAFAWDPIMGWNGSSKSASGDACTCQNRDELSPNPAHQDGINPPFPAVQGYAPAKGARGEIPNSHNVVNTWKNIRATYAFFKKIV